MLNLGVGTYQPWYIGEVVLENCFHLLFPKLFNSSFAETDDYAEIIDEEDTYTMPSSKCCG